MVSDGAPAWGLTVCYPNREPAWKDLPAPQSLEDLREALGVSAGQVLLARHPWHSEQQFAVECLDQVSNGSTVHVHTPFRRIFISVTPEIRRKAVVWYPGTPVEEIERAITKAAGFPTGTPIELLDGEAAVALSVSIPNDTHLEVAAYEPHRLATGSASCGGTSRGSMQSSPSRGLVSRRPAGACGGGTSTSRPSALGTSHVGGNRASSPSLGSSVGDRGSRAAQSPARSKSALAGNSAVGHTTPAVHQSAPEEHCVHVLAGHTGLVFTVCSVGDILFTGSQDSNIMIWDLNNLQYIGTLPGHRGFVKCLAASYAKKILCSGSQDRTIRVWSLETFSTTKTLLGHGGGVNAVVILEGADILVSGSEDRSLRVWDLGSYEVLATLDQAHLSGVFALAQFGSPARVVSGARDRSLKVWDSSTWQPVRTLHPPHYDGVTSLAVASSSGKFYSASRDRSIKEWDMGALANTMHTLHAHTDWVQALCTSPSDDVLFSGSRDSTVKVWNGNLQCQDVLQGHRGPVSALTTVGNRLFSASHDRTVRVWRIDQYS
eukprot:TRINITY_DN6843_c0_g1_i1.p1 TRINITY_DN6843_c0_g1~~TRINITY_DN6843_c0_g1_i1.p1  ORF type:complete len:547 (-),score=54.57 TRINITY_DN6843_c0_g1_i1:156-1796(-)